MWRRKADVTIERQRASVTPEGWRPPDQFVVRGRLPPGEFEFERPTWGGPGDEHQQGHYRFECVTASGARLCLDGTALSASGSHFGQGERFVYEHCLFDHIDFGQRGGGFAPDDARFESCTFRFCRWRWCNATRADFVDCVFEGVMKTAWFYGVNEFARNDFTRAKLRGVEFRAGLDLADSRLPDGPEYLRLDDLPARIAAARAVIRDWADDERRDAEIILDIYEDQGVETLFAWRESLPGADSPSWPLLMSGS